MAGGRQIPGNTKVKDTYTLINENAKDVEAHIDGNDYKHDTGDINDVSDYALNNVSEVFNLIKMVLSSHFAGLGDKHSAVAILNDSDVSGASVKDAFNTLLQSLAAHYNGSSDKHGNDNIIDRSEFNASSAAAALNAIKATLDAHFNGTNNKHTTGAIDNDSSVTGDGLNSVLVSLQEQIDSLASGGTDVDPRLSQALVDYEDVNWTDPGFKALQDSWQKRIVDLENGTGSDIPQRVETLESAVVGLSDTTTSNTTNISKNGKIISENVRDISLIELALLKNNIVYEPSKVKYAMNASISWDESVGKLDLTKGAVSTINTGTNNLTIDFMIIEGFGFKQGQEVTLQDENSSEVLNISSIVDNVITFKSNIQNAYPNGANIYRSNIESISGRYQFGKISTGSVYNFLTPKLISSGSQSKSKRNALAYFGNEIVVGVFTGTQVRLYSIDRFGTVTLRVSKDTLKPQFAIAKATINDNDFLYLHFNTETSAPALVCGYNDNWDEVLPVRNWDADAAFSEAKNVDIFIEGSKIIVGATGNTNSNSFNIIMCSGTISPSGDVTWDGSPKVVTTRNQADIEYEDLAIGYENGVMTVIAPLSLATVTIFYYLRNDQSKTAISGVDPNWTGDTLVSSIPGRLYPVGYLKKINGTNIGDEYMVMVFSGIVKYKYRIVDGGTSWWSGTIDIGEGNNPSLMETSTGDIYILYDAVDGIRQMKIPNGEKTPIENVLVLPGKSGVVCGGAYECTNPFIAFDDSGVYLHGKSVVSGVEKNVLKSDIRIGIDPPTLVDSITSWIKVDSLDGLSFDGFASFINDGEDEVYIDLTDISNIISNGTEVISAGVNDTSGDNVTLKLSITRDLVNRDVNIDYLVGYVSE